MEIGTMADVQPKEVDWLWYPYIPFGKLSMIQGNPGEGKTTLALRIAAACSKGEPLPGCEAHEPFRVFYQNAEDGLEDTIRPRLEKANADLSMIHYIKEDEHSLSMADERIEAAIAETGARLMILDPVQAYVGKYVDMNRANDVRDVMKSLGSVADRTNCAITLIGHLNKAQGMNSSYRGLGSIDFRAAPRSIMLVGRMKNDPNARIVVHDKSSLAPQGKSLAFTLDDDTGFRWLDGYGDISSDDLLGGITPDTKCAEAEGIIRSMLASGEQVLSKKILSEAEKHGISARTVYEAKSRIAGLQTTKAGKYWVWQMRQ